MATKKRKRMSPEQVRTNAKKGDKGPSWFNLPEGVEEWVPEEKGKYRIDVLTYEVTDAAHPDNVPVGHVWYKRAFLAHHGVGSDNKSYVCPRSMGHKRCPMCE